MKAITSAIRELRGLFVEDASFTIGILFCIALAIFVFPHVLAGEHGQGPLLFGALALMLFENVRRTARR